MAVIDSLSIQNTCGNNQIYANLSSFDKAQLFSLAVNFYSPYANYFIFKLKENQTSSIFTGLTVQSANLFFDLESMWQLWTPKHNDSKDKTY